MLIDIYILGFVILIGLCLGSFYNVVILRSLSGESIVFPASKCPKCNHKLYPWHNVPVLSYIFLRGKCHFCKEPISIQYPIVELITMILFLLVYLKFGLSYETLFGFILMSAMLIMTATDLKDRTVDCSIAIGLAVVGILMNTFMYGNILNSVYGLLAGVVILEVVARIGYLFKKGRAMGEADTYVAGALGACFGLQGILMILFYSLIASMIFIIPMYLYNQYKNNKKASCILFILFISALLIYQSFYQNYYMFGIILLIAIFLVKNILSEIKTETNLTYLPYVPSFFVAVLYYFFLLI